MSTVTLVSHDGETIDVDIEVAKKSEVIKNMIDGTFFKKIVALMMRFPLLTFHPTP